MTIKGDPYDYPFDGDLRPANTALMVIDMQFDFCGEGGYVDKMGYDISLTRAAIEPVRKALAAARSWDVIFSTPAKVIAATFRICPPTSNGEAGVSAPESGIPAQTAASWCAANRVGRSSRNFHRYRLRSSSISLAKAASTPPTSN